MKPVTWSLAVLSATSVQAWNVIYYSNASCQGDIVAYDNIASGTDSTCHLPTEEIRTSSGPLPIVRSAQIQGLYDDGSDEGWDLPSRTVRFYSNTNCENNATHRYVIGQMEWNDCVTWPRRSGRIRHEPVQPVPIPINEISFNVVEVGNTGTTNGGCGGRSRDSTLSDGFRVLQHGDRMVIGAQEYRMQQIAATWFREIPASEWHDTLHIENTEHRFAQHGDVDMFGQLKMWQVGPSYMETLPIEEWDPSFHTARTAASEAAENMEYTLRELCQNVNDEADALGSADLFKKVPSLDIVKVCEEFLEQDEPRKGGKSIGIEQQVLAVTAELYST